jgi:hypothetical protein
MPTKNHRHVFFSFELPFLSSSNILLFPSPFHVWNMFGHPLSAATYFT